MLEQLKSTELNNMAKLTRPIVRIYQGNGEFIDREMNDAELAQYEIDQAAHIARKAEEEANIIIAKLKGLNLLKK